MGNPGQSRQAKFGEKVKKSFDIFFSKDAPLIHFYPSQGVKIYSAVP
jgi:hypothetical protein